VTAEPDRLAAALAQLAEGHRSIRAESAIRLDLRAYRGDTWSYRAHVQEKGRGRRTGALQVDLSRWSPDTAEIVVRPATNRPSRSWSARHEARYFRAANVVADDLVAVLERRERVARRRRGEPVWPRLHALADGSRIWVRPLRERDRAPYLRAVNGLSPTTIALRFGRPRSGLRDEEVTSFLDNGHDGREALAATTADRRTIIGVARMAPAPLGPEIAEVAVVVADAWQGRGVGRRLVTDLKECAMTSGYRQLYATSDIENAPVTALLRGQGFRITAASHGMAEWSLDLE
jgi:GNAT superfamily N-acetyltransferase